MSRSLGSAYGITVPALSSNVAARKAFAMRKEWLLILPLSSSQVKRLSASVVNVHAGNNQQLCAVDDSVLVRAISVAAALKR